MFSETWPRSGMTRGGIAFPLQPLAPLTSATGSGSWPTPHANCHTGAGHQGRDYGLNVQTAVKMWPTPAAHEARLGYQRRDTGKKGSQKSRTTVVINLMGGREQASGQLNPQWVEWLMGFPIGHTDLRG